MFHLQTVIYHYADFKHSRHELLALNQLTFAVETLPSCATISHLPKVDGCPHVTLTGIHVQRQELLCQVLVWSLALSEKREVRSS